MKKTDEKGAAGGSNRASPIDHIRCADKIEAKVVDDGPVPRIHGYSVQDDLARHYSFGEVLLLTMTATPPTKSVGRAFERCLTFMAPVSIAEAPAHVARVGRIVDSSDAGVVAVAATALSEQARWLLEEHRDVLDWLRGQRDDFPAHARAPSADERAQVDKLRHAVAGDVDQLAIFDEDPALWPALFGVLYACGLRDTSQLLLAMVQSRLCAAVTEANVARPGDLLSYPVNVPRFRYCHERHEKDHE